MAKQVVKRAAGVAITSWKTLRSTQVSIKGNQFLRLKNSCVHWCVYRGQQDVISFGNTVKAAKVVL